MVKNELQAVLLDLSTNLEIVAAQIQLQNCKLTVLVAYLPPPLSRETIDNLDNLLNQL